MNLPRYLAVAAIAVAAVGCASPTSTPEDVATAEVEHQDESGMPSMPPESATAIATPPPAETPEQWPMPSVVGMSLQDAQDSIQALTGGAVFYSDSHDLTGEDRNQVLDANWQVCTQNIPAGTPITATSAIDLGAVKLTETCP
ncbi:PASTA domain-containing protein [Actinophytocola gossypii]|uniref:PASTA domain-containing protein n=1 Tax=Actinophytocola gossypii TaxID=2812003 RepID=A0ABT2JDJ2_9PSEU|nr:PASTA domain-containing protein [Actinophytocola gossypii]MCT2585952.1 PASTA domain-containing protein [Actinophytocola gossypii]